MAVPSVIMKPEELRPETYFGKLADSIAHSPERVTGFSRSKLFTVAGWVYDWSQKNPKKAHKVFWIVLAFHIWVYNLALHHLDELKSLLQALPIVGGYFGQ